MSVYKLTCSKTNKVYYGSTKNDIKFRRGKGHKKCACSDFITPKLELVEKVSDLNKLEERELYYIKNFDCVNVNGKGNNKPSEETLKKRKQQKIINRKKVIEEKRHYCDLCKIAFQSNKKLIRHIEGYRHKLKNECFLKYGDTWKEHYLIDNQEKYKLNRINHPTV